MRKPQEAQVVGERVRTSANGWAVSTSWGHWFEPSTAHLDLPGYAETLIAPWVKRAGEAAKARDLLPWVLPSDFGLLRSAWQREQGERGLVALRVSIRVTPGDCERVHHLRD